MIYRVAIVAAIAAMTAYAQERPRRVEVHTVQSGSSASWTSAEGPAIAMAPQAATFRFLASESHFDSRVVKNAPYSADGVTEFTQTLGDGTRIHRENTSRMARDSEGRTRHEQQVEVFGTLTGVSDAPRIVTINDPVAGVMYHLNDRDKTAQKIQPVRMAFGDGDVTILKEKIEKLKHDVTVAEDVTVSRQGSFGVMTAAPMGAVAGAPGPRFNMMLRTGESKSESLGKQTIEGVECEGTRETSTIEAGAIGNDRKLVTTTERWYSPALQTVVLSRTNDPVSGETVYRLTNLRRGEPNRSLFEVPADYKIEEGGPGRMFMKTFPRVVEQK